ncbi:riboflavin kinase [Millionella massiliensis]|uniref:riboflavin kinase n=1 Tax=Millionella massiliensis TaxID=1871023 RepID=UPI0024B7FD93|nr:riboflavin kinase [Millionella massiliensis]
MQKTITIRGVVLPGRQLGRTLGFPTANVRVDPQEFDERRMGGVWLARVVLEDTADRYWALVNVGRRPTIEEQGACKAEAWLLDFRGDLYGRGIRIDLLRFLRPETRFDSVEALRGAIENDRKQALKIIDSNEYAL